MAEPNKIRVVTATDIAEAFASHVSEGASIAKLYLSPYDFFMLELDSKFCQHFDRETQRKLIKTGVMGYLWGAIVIVSGDIARGELKVERATEPEISEVPAPAEDPFDGDLEVESPRLVTPYRLAEIFGSYANEDKAIHTIRINPMDFYNLLLKESFTRFFQPSESLVLIPAGTVGYSAVVGTFWGAVIHADAEITSGQASVSTESREAAKTSDTVASIAVSRVRVMGGYFGLDEKQTDDLANDLDKFLCSYTAPPVAPPAV